MTMNAYKFLILSLCMTGGVSLAAGAVIAPVQKTSSARVNSTALPADKTLTLQECIQIALENSPSVVSAELAVQEAQISVRTAQNTFLPTVSASAQQGYNVHKTDGSPRTDHGPASSSIDASLTISGITDIARNIKTQKLVLKQSQLELEDVKNAIYKNVKTAYYALLSAQRTVGIRTKSRDLYKDQYNRAKAFFDRGLRPKVDVTTAEVNLNNEELNLIRARNVVSTASAQLANAMGVTVPHILRLQDVVEYEPFDITLEEAVQKAYANRPDVLAADMNIQISQIKLNQAKAGFWPTFSFSAGFSRSGDDFYLDNEDTKLLAAVQIPIFSAFNVYNGVKSAKLSLEQTRNNTRSLLNNVYLEVQRALIKKNEAAESIPIARLNVQKAKENLDLTRGRYNEGIGDIIEVKDAEISYTDAELSYLTARYDYATAVAELKQAMGMN